MNLELHRHTPTLSVLDPRGLTARTVSYHRLQDVDLPEPCVDRQAYDASGRSTSRWDARLWADGNQTGEPNRRTIYSLSNHPLRTDSVDAGWRVLLPGSAGEALERWDGRSTHRRISYDDRLRPVSVHERREGGHNACLERFTYAGPSEKSTNRCGRLVRHDDPAGSLTLEGYGLTGGTLVQIQRFLGTLDPPDWPASHDQRDALLEVDTTGAIVSYTTLWMYDALGAVTSQTDAVGNEHGTRYDISGQLRQAVLQPVDAPSMRLLDQVAYDASGRVVAGTAGNGVTTTAIYSEEDGFLRHLAAGRPGKVLQDLVYAYDPAGHVTSIEDAAQPTDWFAGTRTGAVNRYRYDTLYRLVEASGRESLLAQLRPGLPDLGGPGGSGDASRRRVYTQTYAYDTGGNLLRLRHTAGSIHYTRTMAVDGRSNRSLPVPDTGFAPDIDEAFDANGNLLRWEGVRGTSWDGRNQLRSVTQIARDAAADDDEIYVYGGDGQRRRKIRTRHSQATTQVAEVRYLPGLEIRTDAGTGEVLHVAVASIGRLGVRHLRWPASSRKRMVPQWRYSVGDHVGSSALELDHEGAVISHEGYYPYGGTAWWLARSGVEAAYKTTRYSGKEHDATGLYYYGFRYYAAWLCRWINPDPAGSVDDINRYLMVGNDPLNHTDPDGRTRMPIERTIHQIWIGERPELLRAHVNTINRNIELADYRFNLHLDARNADAYAEIEKDLKADVSLLRESPFFSRFSQSGIFKAYNDFSSHPSTLAYAADALRVPMVREFGGFYLDVDDQLRNADPNGGPGVDFNSAIFEAGSDEVLTMEPVYVPWEEEGSPHRLQINNSFFAAHASSKRLGAIESEMTKRYQFAVDSGKFPDPMGGGQIGLHLLWNRPHDRAKILSGIVGTRAFTEALAREDAEIGEVLAAQRHIVSTNTNPPNFDRARMDSIVDRKMFLCRFNQIGTANSWS